MKRRIYGMILAIAIAVTVVKVIHVESERARAAGGFAALLEASATHLAVIVD